MNQQNVNAYAAHQQVQMDGREIDKRALLNCASRLQDALNNAGKDKNMYQDAIRHNQHLWTMFQVALTDPASPMPNDLKLTLLRLSGYVDRVSFRAITEFLPEKIESLININRIIAAGLAKKPQQAADPVIQAQMVAAPADQPMAVRIST